MPLRRRPVRDHGIPPPPMPWSPLFDQPAPPVTPDDVDELLHERDDPAEGPNRRCGGDLLL